MSVRVPFLDLSIQSGAVASEFVSKISQLVEGNQFVGGEPIEAFEAAFADFCGSQYCIALNSGTDALKLGLLAAGLERDQEVITSPFTFII